MEILFSEITGNSGHLGRIVLNRPKALNALTGDMCRQIREQLLQWEFQETIKAIIIQGAGDRAFCAGGDIRTLYLQGRDYPKEAQAFFYDEYRMNAAIFHCKKPYIAFLDGITMGGGAGVSVHGSHRIATEKLIFAMPETAIGFFPDVGAGYFLSRCKNKIGYYLGLTGERIDANDAKWLGLVNHVIHSENQQALIEELIKTPISSYEEVTKIIGSFEIKTTSSRLCDHEESIANCFSGNSVEEIVARLEECNNEWSLATVKVLLVKSPISLKVTLRHLERSIQMDLNAVMEMEYNIALQFLKTPDFFEGIRAVVFDKDQSPQWQPATLEAVSLPMLEAYFSQKAGLRLE